MSSTVVGTSIIMQMSLSISFHFWVAAEQKGGQGWQVNISLAFLILCHAFACKLATHSVVKHTHTHWQSLSCKFKQMHHTICVVHLLDLEVKWLPVCVSWHCVCVASLHTDVSHTIKLSLTICMQTSDTHHVMTHTHTGSHYPASSSKCITQYVCHAFAWTCRIMTASVCVMTWCVSLVCIQIVRLTFIMCDTFVGKLATHTMSWHTHTGSHYPSSSSKCMTHIVCHAFAWTWRIMTASVCVMTLCVSLVCIQIVRIVRLSVIVCYTFDSLLVESVQQQAQFQGWETRLWET